MPLLEQDFEKGVDFTALLIASGADHNELIENGTPFQDSSNGGKGLILTTKDSALNTPDVPDPTVDAGFTKWKKYIWSRIPFNNTQKPKIYCWQEDSPDVPTYYRWVEVAADLTQIEADVATALANAAAALALATTANTNANNALNVANTAINNSNTAVTIANNAIAIANNNTTNITNLTTLVTTLQALANTANTNALAAQQAVDALATSITSAKFTSAEFALAAGSTIADVAHGLGSKPRLVRWVLVCQAADQNYAAGDEKSIYDIVATNGSVTYMPFNEATTTTNVSMILSSYTIIAFINKTTFLPVNIDITKWKAKCYAEK